jgi:nucleoside-diphosphate-sugar epimerase
MTESRRILVTGASGFLGSHVVEALRKAQNVEVLAAQRRSSMQHRAEFIRHLSPTTEWRDALTGVSTVIHCAARAHILKKEGTNAEALFRATNTDATLNIARQAAEKGVRRFIFLSSIGVNGQSTGKQPFTAQSAPQPANDYARSKLAAEQGLAAIQQTTGMDVVCVRPPLIYGPGAPGNFQRLIRATYNRWPLPLGCTGNRRSWISVWNLVDLLQTLIAHPTTPNEPVLTSDGEDTTTTEFVLRLGKALGYSPRMIPVPPAIAYAVTTALGKRTLYERLFGNLEIDITATRQALSWQPPLSLDEGLRRTAAAFLEDYPQC